MGNRYPIFVPSKGRADACLTMKALDRVGLDYRVVVEDQEHDAYAAKVGDEKILVLPHRNEGLVVTRNWIWDYALAIGTPKFWTMDDNIFGFFRYNRNLKVPCGDGTFIACLEDFSDRYTNLPICGMNYFMFVSRKTLVPPITFNTRVYSNMLIQTDAANPDGIPYRNEGFYNDDTDLCLRVLKDGFCTALFNAFLIDKQRTMTHGGGMTEHYVGDGRWKMADELRRKHPDVTTITRKWGRWQHHVDYRPFKHNPVSRCVDLAQFPKVDDYGMSIYPRVLPPTLEPSP